MKKQILILLMLVIPVLALAQTAEEYLVKGIAKGELGDYRGALQDFNKAIELDPKNAKAYYNRGTAKSDGLGDHKGAIQAYNKAIELNPNFALAYNNRGLAKLKLGDYKGAIQDINKSIELNPNYADAYYNRGLVKLNLGQKDSGCLDLSKAGEMGFFIAYDAIKRVCN